MRQRGSRSFVLANWNLQACSDWGLTPLLATQIEDWNHPAEWLFLRTPLNPFSLD